MSLEIKDLGIGRLKAEIEKLGRLRITLGVQGETAAEKHPEADVTKGLLAFWLHFGTKKMPARPWVDRAIAEIRDRAAVATKRAISDLIDRRASDAIEAIEPVAEMGLEAMTTSFDEAKEWAEPLAESTIAAKGHDTPLVDTGAIRDAQSYAIRRKDKILRQKGVE